MLKKIRILISEWLLGLAFYVLPDCPEKFKLSMFIIDYYEALGELITECEDKKDEQ